MMTAVVLLAACSQDTADEQPVVLEQDAALRISRVSRAFASNPEYGDIRIFLTNGTTATEGLFKHEGGASWTTQLKLKSGQKTYRLYGYMPDNAAFESSISDWDNNGAVLHIEQLPPLATQDYCIVTGVRKVANASDETAAVRGAFSFNYDSQQENYINLFLDRLYSHIVFSMKVGDDYNALRTIKIKSMKLQLASVSHYNVDITLAEGDGISSVAHTKVAGTETCELTMKDSELTLTTTMTEVCSGYVIPATTLINGVSLVTDYDIYDKKGNKLAEQTATNKLAGPLDALQHGEEYRLQVTIDPSYLYDLSPEDPPFVVIKE